MAVTRLEIRTRAPFLDGQPFGDVGGYERIDGVIYFAVDPSHPANAAIVDLEHAARDAEGRVQFSADFCMLQPLDPARGNRRLLFDVLNRGRKVVQRQLNRAPVEPIATPAIHPGDGFLMRHGWSIAWCGWQWDVVRSDALMGLEAPQALGDGQPIQGQVRIHFQLNEPASEKLLADRLHQPYPAADVYDADATLSVQEHPNAPSSVIPRDQWQFARDQDGQPAPDDTYVRLAGGFQPGKIYSVLYRTRICPVVGTGMLAVRDCTSFLRHGATADGSPAAGRIDHTYAHGTSQSGRFLRTFLYYGMNVDEQGRRVFDGVNPHVAGARRGEFNHRHAQPSVQYTPSFGHLPPHADDEQTDPVTEHTGGLLTTQRAAGGMPKIVATNSGAEYWRGDASLMHTDPLGERDVEPGAETRVYYFAGTQHTAGTLPLADRNPLDGARGANRFNAVEYAPLLRAALSNLDRWVAEGVEPPPSVYPRLDNDTAAAPADVLDAFRRIPAASVADPERILRITRLELGPEAMRGVGTYPPIEGEPYRTYRSAVDADANEVGGVRLPEVSVPVATYTGWNPRHPQTGGEGQILPMLGSTLPFAATASGRAASGDPRPSIAERYRDRDAYKSEVREAAARLVADRYVLAEDLELVVANALRRYDAFAAAPVAAGAGDD